MKQSILQTRFAIRRSRPGTGQGLFASGTIQKGDFVLEYTGTKIPTAEADMSTSRYLFEIDREWTIDGGKRANIARYINHSCAPNCEAQLVDEHVLIYATRKVESGEELTMDYGDEYFDEFIRPTGCKCQKCESDRRSARELLEMQNIAAIDALIEAEERSA